MGATPRSRRQLCRRPRFRLQSRRLQRACRKVQLFKVWLACDLPRTVCRSSVQRPARRHQPHSRTRPAPLARRYPVRGCLDGQTASVRLRTIPRRQKACDEASTKFGQGRRPTTSGTPSKSGPSSAMSSAWRRISTRTVGWGSSRISSTTSSMRASSSACSACCSSAR